MCFMFPIDWGQLFFLNSLEATRGWTASAFVEAQLAKKRTLRNFLLFLLLFRKNLAKYVYDQNKNKK